MFREQSKARKKKMFTERVKNEGKKHTWLGFTPPHGMPIARASS